MVRRALCVVALVVVWTGSTILGAQAKDQPKPVDITGKWTSSFDTQIGTQHYTYDFVVKDGALTGKATSDNGSSEIANGKVEGDKVTFTENLSFQGTDIVVTYSGQITSPDEIKFTRNVGEFATEELVAKRVKDK